MTDPRPRVAVIVFPGSNDDRDATWALHALGAEPLPVWHAEDQLPEVGGVLLPGGFSYGDYLRCGAIAQFAPIMQSVAEFARVGGPVLGVCNGFQILCEAGMLPGALLPNTLLRFVCREVTLRVERADTPFTAGCEVGQKLVIPVKHGEGCYIAPADLDPSQVVFRYDPDDNPNGSIDDIAGVCNEEGNVLGLMPHPEHAVDPLLGPSDGAHVLSSFVEAARQAHPRLRTAIRAYTAT